MSIFNPLRQFDIYEEISQVLAKNQCRYYEVEDILHGLAAHYSCIREQQEYATVEDYREGRKRLDIGDELVPTFNNYDNLAPKTKQYLQETGEEL